MPTEVINSFVSDVHDENCSWIKGKWAVVPAVGRCRVDISRNLRQHCCNWSNTIIFILIIIEEWRSKRWQRFPTLTKLTTIAINMFTRFSVYTIFRNILQRGCILPSKPPNKFENQIFNHALLEELSFRKSLSWLLVYGISGLLVSTICHWFPAVYRSFVHWNDCPLFSVFLNFFIMSNHFNKMVFKNQTIVFSYSWSNSYCFLRNQSRSSIFNLLSASVNISSSCRKLGS